MHIGFIGLGLMGRPMAINVARGGHVLHVWARRAAALEPFSPASGLDVCVHASPAELARHADIIITMVADAPDVEAVLLGENGVAAAAKPGLLAVDMSTIAPAAARRIGARLAERDIDFLDAPVSGGEVGAINATLSIMAGGGRAAFEKMQPVFALMGRNIVHVGEIGAGQVAKACNQIVTGMGVAALAEAFNFARKSGADLARVREALLGGFASSKILENHGQRMIARDFKPGFKAWMHQKDLRIVMEEAHRLGLMLPGAAATAQMFNAVVGSGLGENDSIVLLKLLERMSGGEAEDA
ncbi:MAG: NAD(P)-dependent oxidoreductase [Zoogloeaceae bacterium]|jgi:2-hydroxy-3-oxopropionate reductase|nr:NAD(P)-dependent oxidoreductase [Zoogloeaceae bacterium]